MKRNLIGTLAIVALSLLTTAGAYGQAAEKADVPFAFNVGKVLLPAGAYTVSQLSDNTISIRNAESRAAILSLMQRENPRSGSNKLVFHHVGGQYFLVQVAGEPGLDAMSISTSALEKELIARNPSHGPEEVIVAMK